MNLGLSNLANNYNNYISQQSKVAEQNTNIGFNSILSTKAAQKAAKIECSFKEIWQSRFPGAYYNVMDTSKIDSTLWGRNDYPWEKYFTNNADESVLDWKPSGVEPPMSDPKVQARINSTIGKKAIVVPPQLEEKMKNDSELAKRVLAKVENFIASQDAANPNPRKGYLIALDENGEIAHTCVTSEKMTVSSSEMVESYKRRKEKHAEYERMAEETVLKHKLQEQQVADRKVYTSNLRQEIMDKYEKNTIL